MSCRISLAAIGRKRPSGPAARFGRAGSCPAALLPAFLAVALRRPRPSSLPAAFGSASCRRRPWPALGDQGHRLVQRHRLRVLALRQGRVDLAVVDIRAVAAVAHRDRAAASGWSPSDLQRRRRAAGGRRGPSPLLGDQRHGAVDADREHLLDAVEIGIGAVMQDERAVAAEAGRIGLPLSGCMPTRAAATAASAPSRGRCVGRPALREAGALGLLAVAELDIGAEAAAAQGDLLARLRDRRRDVPSSAGRPRHCRWRRRRAGG